jgi:hypothetical protein
LAFQIAMAAGWSWPLPAAVALIGAVLFWLGVTALARHRIAAAVIVLPWLDRLAPPLSRWQRDGWALIAAMIGALAILTAYTGSWAIAAGLGATAATLCMQCWYGRRPNRLPSGGS